MKHIFLLFWIILCSGVANAQKENNVWAFGSSGGLDFNSGTPVPIKTSIIANQGCASVASRTTGQLLFYTNGLKVWNRNNLPMPHAIAVSSVPFVDFSAQPCVIVPVLNDTNRYYVFSLGGSTSVANACILSYSVVDMTLNNGLGDVVTSQMDVPLGNRLKEKMVAVPGDNCNVWLIVHSLDSSFKAYEITAAGINPNPVVSNVGYQYFQPTSLTRFGIMKVSPDRHKIVMTTTFGNTSGFGPGAEVFQFDPATGILSNPIAFDGDEYFGACFSPDNTKVYFSVFVFGSGNYVVQYDVSQWTTTAVNASKSVIDGVTGSGEDLQLGPDGKIYLARLLKDSLGIINNPNAAGPACNYQRRGMAIFPGTIARSGLPNRTVYPLPPDTSYYVHDTFLCSNIRDTITMNAMPGYASYLWNDLSTDTVKKTTDAGKFWVVNKNVCHSRMDSFSVRKINVSFSLGNDTVFCNANPYTLQVTGIDNGASYLWQNGNTASSFTTNTTGNYSVTVANGGCTNSDTVHLSFITLPLQTLANATVCDHETITLVANVADSATVRWDDGSTADTMRTNTPGLHYVVVSEMGCTSTGSMILAADSFCDCHFTIPDVFSPNGDGRNDKFHMLTQNGCPVTGFSMNIYNRWGQLVYTGTDNNSGWDGSYNGQPAETGTYMYTMRFELGSKNKLVERKGDVTLVR